MSDAPQTEAKPEGTEKPKKAKAAPVPAGPDRSKYGRRRLRTEGRNKRKLKLGSDKEFAKAYFEARSKRSTEKKSAFRKKKTKKK